MLALTWRVALFNPVAGWGRTVADHKHVGQFGDELVEAMAEMIQQRWQPNPESQWVCCVTSSCLAYGSAGCFHPHPAIQSQSYKTYPHHFHCRNSIQLPTPG